MREETRWEKFKKRFIWGSWPWLTVGFYWGHILVIGKLKIIFPEPKNSQSRSK